MESITIEFVCDECGDDLETAIPIRRASNGDVAFVIKPCKRCLDAIAAEMAEKE